VRRVLASCTLSIIDARAGAARRRWRSAGRALVLGGLLTAAALASEPQPSATPTTAPAEETFYEAIQVRTAEVEVVVTDRKGNRITGLGREEFTLYEDGQSVELTGFAAFAPAAEQAPTAAGSAELVAPPPPQPVAAPKPTASVVVLLDNQSLTLSGRKRLLEQVRRLVTELGPEARIGVMSQDSPGELRMGLAPSEDRAAVLAAIETASKVVPRGNQTYSETQRLAREIGVAPGPGEDVMMGGGAGAPVAQTNAQDLYDQITAHASQLQAQAMSTAAALEQLVEALAGLPGRKAVVMVSGGVPQKPAEALISAWRNRFGQSNEAWRISSPFDEQQGDVSTVLARTAAHANGSRVAIYGLVAPAVPGRLSADMGAGDAWTETEEWKANINLRDSMQQLVGPTGGVAGFDQGAKLVVNAIGADLESYYTLAYTPRERGRGRDHKLKVEVSRPGLSVRHRLAYRERTSGEQMAEHTRAALLFGWQDNPLGIAVDVGAPTPGERRNTSELPLTITLPLSQVVLVPQGPVHEGRLSIHVAATDEAGRSSPVSSVEVPVRVANENLLAALSQQLAYRTRLAVRETRQQIAVTVRDELGNQAATVLVVHPPAEPTAQVPAKGPAAVGGSG
jgi:VWFA-related protein